MDKAMRDRAVGALVGLAAGDALGAAYEFHTDVKDPVMKSGGLGNWEKGEWTDDTQMAICIARSLSKGKLDLDDIAQEFRAWYPQAADVGVQTSNVLSSSTSATSMMQVAERYFEHHPEGAAGNGSLMRTAPVALTFLGDDDALATAARDISSLTHADPRAGDACVLWCIAIDRAVRERRLDGIDDGLSFIPPERRSDWEKWIEHARRQPPSTFSDNGFVVTALQAALSAITHAQVPDRFPCQHLVHALKAAVEIGKDTDTVAAIAGSLLGAYWGGTAVPLRSRGLLHGWPGVSAGDLTRWALLTRSHGEPDSIGWPSADDLLPDYEARGEANGMAVELPREPRVVLGDALALRTKGHEVDVILSLGRVGRKDAPEGVEHHEVLLLDDASPEANPNLDFMLVDMARSISEWVDLGRSVLVHCVGGTSRTPTVGAAFLADRFGMPGSEALREVRSLIPGGWNKGFEQALQRIWPQTGERPPSIVDLHSLPS